MPPFFLPLLSMLLGAAPWLITGTVGVILFSRSVLGRAVIRRLQEGSTGADAVLALQAAVEELRREVGELQERVDFTERFVVQQRGVLPSRQSARSDTPSPPEPVSASHR